MAASCKTLSLLFCLACISPAWAQDFIYKHYGLQDGLTSPTIHSIFQDKDGFLWFGTESGLCRYDGARFKTFTVKDGLPCNEVFGMFQDSKDRIWLQLYKNTIAYILRGKVYTQDNDELLKKITLSGRVYGIAEDRDGNICWCDNSKVYILPPGGKTIKTIYPGKSLSSNLIALNKGSDGRLIVCTNHALCSLEKDSLKFTRALVSNRFSLSPTVVLLHPAYMAYDNEQMGRTVFLRDTVIHIRIPINYTLKYSAVSDSVLSVNTADGAFLFNIHNYSMVKVLPGIKVTNVFMDRENNLWLGTAGKGIYKISSLAIANKKVSDKENDIYYITKEEDKIIVGDNSLQVFAYDKKRFVNRPVPGNRKNFMWKVFYYEKLNSRTAFLAHPMGLMNYAGGAIKASLNMAMLKQVVPAGTTSVLVAAHHGIMLVKKDGLRVIDTIWHRKSLSVLKTNDSILAGTLAGLFILKKENNRYSIIDSLLPASIIAFMKRSANGMIWVCTYEDGLYCINHGRITRHFTDTSGLPGNNGRSLGTRGNDVWMGTDKGLVKITPAGDDFRVQEYGTSDGLPSNIINSIYLDSNLVYIGTPEGLCYFDEKKIETNSICNLVLTGVRIGDSLAGFSDRYSLGGRQRFELEFSGISFRSEQEMSYRYKINGLDDEWRHTGLNTLVFTSFPYGDYELQIIAVNKSGKKSRPLVIKFHVTKPFYKQTWFILAVVLLPLAFILFVYNRRSNLAKQRQMQKLKQEIKFMELEQMALRAQMNPHFIFNCISALQQLVTEKDTRNAGKFITGFANLVRQTLDNAPELFITLEEEIKFLGNYLELEKIRLEDCFSCLIRADDITNAQHLLVPNMVIQPFVENAIRHGIRYKSDGKGCVEVAFEQRDGALRCTITDNGIGREKASQIRKELGTPHTPKGMGITFKRIESLNTLTHKKISITVEDRMDKQHHACGTKVIIDFYKTEDYYDQNSHYRR